MVFWVSIVRLGWLHNSRNLSLLHIAGFSYVEKIIFGKNVCELFHHFCYLSVVWRFALDVPGYEVIATLSWWLFNWGHIHDSQVPRSPWLFAQRPTQCQAAITCNRQKQVSAFYCSTRSISLCKKTKVAIEVYGNCHSPPKTELPVVVCILVSATQLWVC